MNVQHKKKINSVDKALSPQSRCVSIITKSFKLSNTSIHLYSTYEYFIQIKKKLCASSCMPKESASIQIINQNTELLGVSQFGMK